MPKAIYERRVLQLNPQNVIVLHGGHGKKGLIREYRDTKSVGLTLRIMERQAVWYLRRRDMTLRLGLSFEIELWKARYIADHTRLAAQKKRDLRTFVKAMVRMEADPGSGKKSIACRDAGISQQN